MASNDEGASPNRPRAEGLAGEEEISELVRQTQQGDDQAFDTLVERIGGTVYNLAYRLCGNPSEAEDLTQEVLVRLHKKIRLFRWQSRFSTWLYALATRTCRSRLRWRWRRASSTQGEERGGRLIPWDEASPNVADPSDAPDQAASRVEISEAIQAAIGQLPQEFREAVVLRDVEGLSYDEIAVVLGVSVGTVKSRVARGRLRLKERLAPLLHSMP